MKRWKRAAGENRGTAGVEEIVLIAAVAIGFAGASVPLGNLLLGYHRVIEYVLLLPVP